MRKNKGAAEHGTLKVLMLETNNIPLKHTLQMTPMWKTSVSVVLINALVVVLLASCASYATKSFDLSTISKALLNLATP